MQTESSKPEPLHITQLCDKGTMLDDKNFGVDMLAQIGHDLFYSSPINKKGFSDPISGMKVFHIAVVLNKTARPLTDSDVFRTFTIWKEWCSTDEDDGYYPAIRLADGMLTPAEALRSGHEAFALESPYLSHSDEAAIAINIYHQILLDLCVRHSIGGHPIVDFRDVSLFRVTKPIPGDKWVWSDWSI